MSWRRRALAFRALSLLPGGGRLLDAARHRVGVLRHADVGARMRAVTVLADMLARVDRSVEGATLCEVGAGWHPVVPAVFYGMGARSIVMTDIAAHMQAHYVAETVEFLLDNADEVASIVDRPVDQLRDRWEELRHPGDDWRAGWASRGVVYVAPHDFARPIFPSDTFDVVFSNSVLGFVPAPALAGMFAETARILKPGGCLAHRITTSDQFAITDPTISPINFLSFTEDQWARLGNSRLHHQNRRRPAAYVELARDAGLKVLLEDRSEPLDAEVIDQVDLAPEFRGLPEEELTCVQLLLVAEKL